MRRIAAALVGAAAIAGGARLSFALPGVELPQTGQTLAVLLVGAALGRWGGVAVALYVLAGALGLPVFAEGRAGLEVVLGPSGGYLLGFALAAVLVGLASERDGLRGFAKAVGMMVLAHVVLLVCGGGLLVPRAGLAAAWSGGVAPFLVGGVVKSVLAAIVVVAMGERWPLLHRSELGRTSPG